MAIKTVKDRSCPPLWHPAVLPLPLLMPRPIFFLLLIPRPTSALPSFLPRPIIALSLSLSPSSLLERHNDRSLDALPVVGHLCSHPLLPLQPCGDEEQGHLHLLGHL